MRNPSERFDELYTKSPTAFLGAPIESVQKIPEILKTGKVLDIGAGSGTNSLFLARLGFHIKAVDISKVAMQNLNQTSEKENLLIETRLIDITTELPDPAEFDIIILSFVLHYQLRARGEEILRELKEKSSKGSLHAISMFTSDGDFFSMEKNKDHFYPNPGELKELYTDWEILFFDEKITSAWAKNDKGEHMKNLTSYILARKI